MPARGGCIEAQGDVEDREGVAGCTKHIHYCCRHDTILSTHAQTRPGTMAAIPQNVSVHRRTERCTSSLQGMHSKRRLPPQEERCTSSLQPCTPLSFIGFDDNYDTQRYGPAAGLAAGPMSVMAMAMAKKDPLTYPAPKQNFAATAPLFHNAVAWLLQSSAQDTCLTGKARRSSVCV